MKAGKSRKGNSRVQRFHREIPVWHLSRIYHRLASQTKRLRSPRRFTQTNLRHHACLFRKSKGEGTYRWIKPASPEFSPNAWRRPFGFGKIIDGSSNTVTLIEDPKGQTWTNNAPATIDQAINLVKQLPDGQKLLVIFYDNCIKSLKNQQKRERLFDLFHPSNAFSLTYKQYVQDCKSGLLID